MNRIQIHRIYTKNLRFELSDSGSERQDITQNEEWTPQIQLQINPRSKLLKSGRHEVVLAMQTTLSHLSEPLVQIYLEQAGLFTLSPQTPPKQLDSILYGACANIVFPYISASVNMLLAQAAFPPIYLAPLDFVALYQQYLAQQRSKNDIEEKFTVSSSYNAKTLH